MNDQASQYEKQPGTAHVDGRPLGSERPPFEIPTPRSEPPMVMPVGAVNASLSKGSIAGTLDHSLAGVTGTTQALITHKDGQPVGRETIKPDPLLPR